MRKKEDKYKNKMMKKWGKMHNKMTETVKTK